MTKKDSEIKKAAKEFAEYWKGKGYEKGESQPFWLELLGNVFGIENPAHYIEFEDQVHIDKSTGFIDGYIPETKVLIEQKSIDKDLNKPIRQSDGSMLNPFQQAKKYIAELPLSRHPRWVITCNFKEFYIYDMENPNGEPEKILLENLPKEYYRLNFLVDTGNENIKREEEISIQAGEIVGRLYDAISKQYVNLEDKNAQRSLNILCVRLVFCFYAEDSGVFGKHLMFHDYLKEFDTRHFRSALIELFKVLNTKPEDRDPYMDDDLAAFPYVNGGLFADENIEIPQFTDEIITLILQNASEDFDWSEISPTIFGAVFESTLNPETRRSGGMHYTSIENIHKVIDPLFLDELKAELEEIKELKQINVRKEKLEKYCDKLASLKFLDPACGSGNFLTETYISLRKLENEALSIIFDEGPVFKGVFHADIKVSIKQFYGIEINDFAVSVAKTALWIAESQMMNKTKEIVFIDDDFLPLKTNAYIVEGNALRIDWNDVVPANELNYIMGNPPFAGKKEQTRQQKDDLNVVFSNATKKTGVLDYVSGWFFKASIFMENYPRIKTAFVSTDSICQGQQVPILWSLILNKNLEIDFAHRTFKWDSEAKEKAEVYCIIVGFSSKTNRKKEYQLFQKNHVKLVSTINPYLLEAPNIWVDSRSVQISGYSKINYGSMPIDNGELILSEEDYQFVLKHEPDIIRYVKKYAGADELLKGKVRYCLWLKNANRKDILNSKFLTQRVSRCKQFREKSNREATKKLAQNPELFGEDRQPNGLILVIPKVSSKHRRYIPICMVDSEEFIINGSSLIVPDGDLLEFGLLSSNVHNAWIRAIAETWGHSYQYSTDIYNNFPVPSIDNKHKEMIEKTAQNIINIRNSHKDLTLAEMYNPKLGIISDLLTAHQQNDKAVMQAYGFNWRTMTESECVAELMKMYQKLTEKNSYK